MRKAGSRQDRNQSAEIGSTQVQAKQTRKDTFIGKLNQLETYFQEATNLSAVKNNRAKHFTDLIEIVLSDSPTKATEFNKHRDQFMIGKSRYQSVVKTITFEEMAEFVKDKEIVAMIASQILKGYDHIYFNVSLKLGVSATIQKILSPVTITHYDFTRLDSISSRLDETIVKFSQTLQQTSFLQLTSEELLESWNTDKYQDDISKLKSFNYLELLKKHINNVAAFSVVLNLISDRCKFSDKIWIGVKQFKPFLNEWLTSQASSSTAVLSVSAQEEMLTDFYSKALLDFNVNSLNEAEREAELSSYQGMMYKQFKHILSTEPKDQKGFYFLVQVAQKTSPLLADDALSVSNAILSNTKMRMIARIAKTFLQPKEKALLISAFLDTLAKVTQENQADAGKIAATLLDNYTQLISYGNEYISVADEAETFYALLYCASELRQKIADDLTQSVVKKLSKVDNYLKQKDSIVYTENYRVPRLVHFKKMYDLVYENTGDIATREAEFNLYRSHAPQGGRNTYPELISELSFQEWLEVAEQPSVKQLFNNVLADLEKLPQKVVAKATTQLELMLIVVRELDGEQPKNRSTGLFHLYTSSTQSSAGACAADADVTSNTSKQRRNPYDALPEDTNTYVDVELQAMDSNTAAGYESSEGENRSRSSSSLSN